MKMDNRGLIRHSPAKIPDGPSTFKKLIENEFNKPEKQIAIIHGDRSITYNELRQSSYRVANALLEMGVRKGDRIAVSMLNGIGIIEAFLGTMQMGAIWVGLNLMLSDKEKAYLLQEIEARLFIGDAETINNLGDLRKQFHHDITLLSCTADEKASEWDRRVMDGSIDLPYQDIDPYAPAAIAYTSGTTGKPKGTVHSQHNILLCGKKSSNEKVKGKTIGVILPLTILNLMICGPVIAFANSCAISIFNDFSASEIVHQVKNNNVAALGGCVPAIFYDLIKDKSIKPEDLDNFILPGAGGATCTDEFKDTFKNRFGKRLYSGYGLTEAPGPVVVETEDIPRVKGGTGKPLPHIQLHIIDGNGHHLSPGEVGEVCIGPQKQGEWANIYSPMLGYWNNPELTKKALAGDVLHTGDLGKIDEEGNLYVLERKDDMIIRGGNNIYPAEIEDVLMRHNDIAACAVFGKPHERLGETIISYVELKEKSTLAEEEIKLFLSKNLAKYKIPEEIIFRENLPKNAMGKVIKERLKHENCHSRGSTHTHPH